MLPEFVPHDVLGLRIIRRFYVKQVRFWEEKSAGILREAEKGETPIADVCREHGISEQKFCRGRREYGGLNTSDEQRLKELTSENARLKRLLAERDLEVDTLKEHECLNMDVFYSLVEAKTVVETWWQSYNNERRHSSLSYQTPAEFAAAWRKFSVQQRSRPSQLEQSS